MSERLSNAELENIRLAARALKGNVEDPDIEKKVIVEGSDGKVLIGSD